MWAMFCMRLFCLSELCQGLFLPLHSDSWLRLHSLIPIVQLATRYLSIGWSSKGKRGSHLSETVPFASAGLV